MDDPTIEVWLPPEVCGAISLAEGHLQQAKENMIGRTVWRRRVQARKHLEKAQKLIARAKRLLNGRELP